MAENSKIEWTDHTFNPWVGCTKVSSGCDHCYAEGWAKRTGGAALWQGERRRTSEANWRKPVKWNKQAEAEGKRYRVFCASLADVFDNQAEPEWRTDLFALIRATPQLDWLLLSKRPQNIAKMLPPDWGEGYPNVWLGTTVENQTEAARRIPHLLAVPARVRFLSCEPLLGPVNLQKIDCLPWLNKGKPAHEYDPHVFLNALTGLHNINPIHGVDQFFERGIDWIIVGGESGANARPMHPDWARSLRDQCAAGGVAFFFKQWGEWFPECQWEDNPTLVLPTAKGMLHIDQLPLHAVGKNAAGRLLDGVEHNAMPKAIGGAAASTGKGRDLNPAPAHHSNMQKVHIAKSLPPHTSD